MLKKEQEQEKARLQKLDEKQKDKFRDENYIVQELQEENAKDWVCRFPHEEDVMGHSRVILPGQDQAYSLMINNLFPFTKANLLWSGRENSFDWDSWYDACKGIPNTFAVIRIQTREWKTFGMFTDLPWTDDGKNHKGTGKSWVFRADR